MQLDAAVHVVRHLTEPLADLFVGDIVAELEHGTQAACGCACGKREVAWFARGWRCSACSPVVVLAMGPDPPPQTIKNINDVDAERVAVEKSEVKAAADVEMKAAAAASVVKPLVQIPEKAASESAAAARSAAEQAAEVKAAVRIQLMVNGRQGRKLQCKIGKSASLRKLKDAYCSRFGLQSSHVSFWVDGVRVAPHDTAEKFGLEDDDCIVAAILRARGSWRHGRVP